MPSDYCHATCCHYFVFAAFADIFMPPCHATCRYYAFRYFLATPCHADAFCLRFHFISSFSFFAFDSFHATLSLLHIADAFRSCFRLLAAFAAFDYCLYAMMPHRATPPYIFAFHIITFRHAMITLRFATLLILPFRFIAAIIFDYAVIVSLPPFRHVVMLLPAMILMLPFDIFADILR